MVRSRSVAIDALAGPESTNPFARTPMAAVQNGGLRVEPLLAKVPLTVLFLRAGRWWIARWPVASHGPPHRNFRAAGGLREP